MYQSLSNDQSIVKIRGGEGRHTIEKIPPNLSLPQRPTQNMTIPLKHNPTPSHQTNLQIIILQYLDNRPFEALYL